MNFRSCIIRDSNSDVLTRKVNEQLYAIVSEIDPLNHKTSSSSFNVCNIRHVSYEDALAELSSLQKQNKTQG